MEADKGSSSSSSQEPETMSAQLLESLNKKIQSSQKNFETLQNYGEKWFALIYRIPVQIREVNEGAYTPSVVSIGPLHRGAQHLQAMEEHKLSYMRCLFLRSGEDKYEQTKQLCVHAMLKIESELPKCYPELYIGAENEEATTVMFAEMMLIDGCFIIELLYRNYERITDSLKISDPILDNYSKMSAIQHDFILLENQIPFDVLDELFCLTVETILEHTIKSQGSQYNLRKFIFYFFKDVMVSIEKPNYYCEMPFHILDYLHTCYLFSDQFSYQFSREPDLDDQLPKFKYSATQLDLAGVEFKPENSKSGLTLIKFHTPCLHVFRSARFEIPPFHITYSTETFFRNLIAVEQLRPAGNRRFTSHAFLMDKLVNTAKDVDLLVEAGVIHNYLGSSEEVAHLYNNICKNVNVSGFYFTEPCKQATDYCKRWWPRIRVKLKRDYFGNPWAGLSIFAGFSIFVLTLLQTIYAMK